MSEKIREAHSYVDGVDVAKMLMEFKREFRDVYPNELMVSHMMAVGPMQSFIGLAIKNGYLNLQKKDV